MDGFIDGDAALGMSSAAPVTSQATQEMVDEAAAMLRGVRPFGRAGARGGGRGEKRGGRGGRGRGGRGRGRGVSGGASQQAQQPEQHPYSGPGMQRPVVSTFIVNQGMRQLIGQFASETLVYALQQQNYQTMMNLDEEARRQMGLPETVQSYHSLFPLENYGPSVQQSSRVVSIPTLALKAVHHGDGAGYMLRRLDGRHVIPTPELLETCRQVVMGWSPVVNHPNVVGLREAFVSDEIMDTPSVFLTFDYHPGACTLEQLFIKAVPADLSAQKATLTEDDLWSFLVQMTSALRAIHSAGLEVGSEAFHPSKVLLCSPNRIRLGFLGVSSILAGRRPMGEAQLMDLSALGTLMLTIACASRNEPSNLDTVVVHYSKDLCHVIAGLLAAHKGNGFKDWRNLAAALGPKLIDEIDMNQTTVDIMAVEMTKEIENGRIARFLIKLNMVVERAEFMGDTRWSDTGDRYLLKLFRDFIFHQVDDQGNPLNDWGLVVEAINKADAGLDEKIMLLSRDETSMLVVSYADIQRCLAAAYDEIANASQPIVSL